MANDYFTPLPEEKETVTHDYFTPLEESKPHQHNWLTALKEGFSEPTNSIDRALSSVAAMAVRGGNARPASLGGGENKISSDDVFKALEDRIASRKQWANPYNEEVPLVPSLVGKAVSLPAQIAGFFASPFETGQAMLKNGETLPKAFAGTGVATAGVGLGSALPMSMGGNILTKGVTGAVSNVAQSAAQGTALSALSDTAASKKQFTPTPKSLAEAGILGFGFGAVGPTTPLRNPFKKPKTILEELPELKDPTQEPQLDIGKESAEPINREYMAKREADDAARSHQENLNRIDSLIEQRQADLVKEVRGNVARAKANEINDANLTRLQEERSQANSLFENQAQALAAEKQRQLLSTGEEAIGNGKSITRPMATESSGVMGEIAPPEQGPVGLSTGEGLPAANTVGQRAMGDSGLMGLPKPPETPPVGLSTGENGVARDSGRQRAQGPSNLLGEPLPAFDPWGSIGGSQRRQGGLSRRQSGKLDFEGLVESTGKFFKGLHSLASDGLKPVTTKGEYLLNNLPGIKQDWSKRVAPADSPEKIIADSVAYGKDIPSSHTNNLESGLTLAASKFAQKGQDHPLVLGAARILHEYEHTTALQQRELTKPVHDAFQRLSTVDRGRLADVMANEEKNNTRYNRADLEKVLNKKQLDAYDMDRALKKELLTKTNEERVKLGKKPITEREAYMANMRSGDYQFAVKNKAGETVWFSRFNNMAEGNAALKYLNENFKDQLDLSKTKVEKRREGSLYNPNTPRDVMGVYHDMMDYIDGKNKDLAQAVKTGLENFIEEKGYDTLNHKQRFKNKTGIRGFEGDKPWLSPEENSRAMLQSQANYHKNAIQWMNALKAADSLAKILSDEKLKADMPHAMELVKQVVDNSFGGNKNIMASVEQAVVSILPSTSAKLTSPSTWKAENFALGRSQKDLYGVTTAVKAATYLVTLGVDAAHFLATIAQPAASIPSQSRVLSLRGYKHNPAVSTILGISDFSAGMAEHSAHALGHTSVQVPMTKIGRKGLHYAEDNSVINKNPFDESANIGANQALEDVKQTAGFSIGLGEKMSRLGTFMYYVHQLDQSGKFKGNDLALFRKAHEQTDITLTGFARSDRPMIVDKLGVAGQGMYTFHSYMFNYFHQLSQNARLAKQGSPTPFMLQMGAGALVGGALSNVFVNVADSAWNGIKNLISILHPEWYHYVQGKGVKDTIMEHLPDFSSFGLLSSVTGSALTNKMSMDPVDFSHPTKGLNPLFQDIKEAGSMAHAFSHPNSTTATQAIYDQMPRGIQGNMENNMDVFKGYGEGSVINPRNLMSGEIIDYTRTPEDKTKRAFGLTPMGEAKASQTNYSNAMESKRIKTATTELAKNVFDDLRMGRDTQDAINSYLELNPESKDLEKEINNRILGASLKPSERQLIAARTIQQIEAVKRLREVRGQ